MSVTIHLHKSQRHLADGKAHIDVEGRTVNDCLADLIHKYPDLKDNLFENPRQLNKNVEIYVNLESAYPGELKKPVRNGDEIHITLMLSGG